MKLVFLLEERSMKLFLEGLLPRILPSEIPPPILIPHEGKSDLEKSIPRKLRAWQDPDACFVIVRDQDHSDCHEVKAKLVQLCHKSGRKQSLVRIACRELESWFLGDLDAIDAAFSTHHAKKQNKSQYRVPDTIGSPARELEKLVPGYGKVSGARALGPLINIENNRSVSFACFVSGVRHLVQTGDHRQ